MKPLFFDSFFIGGFEASTHRTAEGRRMDLIAATQHDVFAREDYDLCRSVGIRVVREAARWPVIDQRGTPALNEVRKLARLGRDMEVTQIWDLMHYGYPDDLDPFTSEFLERFVAYVRAVATVIREESAGILYFTPVNEISYFCWAAGEVGYMAPFCRGRGGELKRALVQVSIQAINAIWHIDPSARIVNVDPLVHLHAPRGRPDLQDAADDFNCNAVTEAYDMLSGRRAQELGGSRAHLGIAGFNYYACNQWTIATPEQPQSFLSRTDPRWVLLPDLLCAMEQRYGGPLIIGETGSVGEDRAEWLAHVAGEVQRALARGIDVQGVCWYPVITSPDWEDPTAFFDGGLFDVVPEADGNLRRIPSPSVITALRQAQAALDCGNVSEELLTETIPGGTAMPSVVSPLENGRFKADNFSYQVLAAGDSLVIELYCLEPGASVWPHCHQATEHVLTVFEGEARICVASHLLDVHRNETVLVPAGLYHSLHNESVERLVIQQVSAPKPWDARFQGPHPHT